MTSVNATQGSTGGNPAPTQNGGGLKGIPPNPFTGNRSESGQFKREMLRYIKLNSEHELIKEPYSRILYCLGLFKGPAIQLWVNNIEDAMELEIADATTATNKSSITLWTSFIDAFDQD